MARPRVRINSAGARALLGSAAVQGDLDSRAAAIASAACSRASPDDMDNPPYMSAGAPAAGRARARAFASSTHGARDNNKHNTLLKSLDAGR